MKKNREGRVLRLTLDRPEKRNALDAAMCRDLVNAFDDAERDESVGCVLLEAEGSVFCSGMDLDEALAVDAAALSQLHEALFTAGARLRVPVVGAIGGPALAGGLGLVANMHIAIAAQGSSFGLTEIRVGLWPFQVYRAVEAAIGPRRTMELSLTGRIFGTQEALQWGLVQHVVPAFELEDRAWAIAEELAGASPEAVCRGMEFARLSRGLDWKAGGELAQRARAAAFASADFREGVTAFREKRKPAWPSLL
ncbi:MAG TPA: enoyl-CoA hydratase/isomerase family protein [Bryobacteraceae bacterium]|nr:enoyl-CoA hydratase/isomerase family protein [Bryobacteraceae bacterium]